MLQIVEIMFEQLIESGEYVNESLSEVAPLSVITATVASVLFLQKVYHLYQHWDSREIKKQLLNNSVKAALHLPVIGPKVKKELDNVNQVLTDIAADIDKSREPYLPAIEKMPAVGLSHDEILKRFEHLQDAYHEGRLSGAVYAKYDEGFIQLLEKIWGKTALTNPMHDEWPLIKLLEAEIISMCANLLHATEPMHGIVTHGGSTSILEACKAYVLDARKRGIEQPEIIVAESAHVSFDKAAEILNCRLVKIPLDSEGKLDVSLMKKAINKRTCLLVGSAPSFTMGIIDPIEAMAEVALEKNIPLHVDCCLGGFVNAFAKDAGFEMDAFDFRISGVTSISIDTHKYAWSPKGTSVLLILKNISATPTHVYLNWVGGMMITQGIDGSRSGADIATTWATLAANGHDFYVNQARLILSLQRQLVAEINRIAGIRVAHQPKSSVVGIYPDNGINILVVASKLKEFGWSVAIIQNPDQKAIGIHFCLTSVHANQPEFYQTFVDHLKQAVAYSHANPNAVIRGTAKIYGKMAKGVPFFVQEQIGRGYAELNNSIRPAKV